MPKGKTPTLLRGMRDILPEESELWYYVINKASSISRDYGFTQVETPMLEQTSLFVRGLGKDTDVVQKEMFSFEEEGENHITVRPEMTAGMARAYIEHGWLNKPQPVKLFQIGPCFRHERPQAGRHRQFSQWDIEVLGYDHPVIDAEVLTMAYGFFQELGIPVEVQLNSIGTLEFRKSYIHVLQEYYRTRKRNLCLDCKKRFTRNPLRLLDCKVQACQDMASDAPIMVDHLDDTSRKRFESVLDHLDHAEVPYSLNPRLVRGLDYYTHTVFEFFAEGEEGISQGALLSGGRYDGLLEELGGRETPGCGFAAGIERIVMRIRERMQKGEFTLPLESVDFYVAQLGEQPRKRALHLFELLRREGLNVSQNFSRNGLKAQLSQAAKLNAKFTLIFGQKELMDNTVLIRDMENGSQEVVDFKKIAREAKKRLEKWIPRSTPPSKPLEEQSHES